MKWRMCHIGREYSAGAGVQVLEGLLSVQKYYLCTQYVLLPIVCPGRTR
jgi:hypothetical protein